MYHPTFFLNIPCRNRRFLIFHLIYIYIYIYIYFICEWDKGKILLIFYLRRHWAPKIKLESLQNHIDDEILWNSCSFYFFYLICLFIYSFVFCYYHPFQPEAQNMKHKRNPPSFLDVSFCLELIVNKIYADNVYGGDACVIIGKMLTKSKNCR